MSLMKTKPRWCEFAVATDRGWVNERTGELLVSLKNLKSLLDAENKAAVVDIQKFDAPVVTVEEVKKKPRGRQKIIAEVVEYPDVKVIGE